MKPKEVHEVLKSKGVKWLYHANTVATSCSFLEQGALLSRGYVEEHGLIQTAQSSDAIDKKFGIWNCVFLDHVDIHGRAGRKVGPNAYGPVLFKLPVDVLLALPAGSEVKVTRMNPVYWSEAQADGGRWYLTPDALSNDLHVGDFDKMLVIQTPEEKVDFLDDEVTLSLDDPKRALASGEHACRDAAARLADAAKKGGIRVDGGRHKCCDECVCVEKYAAMDAGQFETWFA
jgi:hypothetical protein